MPEIRTRNAFRRIAQNTEPGKRMLDSFLDEKRKEESDTKYAADHVTGGITEITTAGVDLIQQGIATPRQHPPTQRDTNRQPRGRPVPVKPTGIRMRASTRRITPTPATGGWQVTTQAAAQSARNAQRTHAAASTARTTARKAADAASRAVREIIAGAKSVTAALTAGSSIAITIIVVLCLVGLLVCSGFGIFFSAESSNNDQDLQTVVREINEEYAQRLDREKAGYSYTTVEISGSRAPWPEVLAVYAVHTTATTDVMMMDDTRALSLRDIFWQMHQITSALGADGHLTVTISHKTTDEMAELLRFTPPQRSQLTELLSEENQSLWNAAIYGTDGNTDMVAVALSQIGNVGGEPYWSWYGFESHVQWCACFVSWCANECGYLDAGTLPRFSSCSDGVQWFQERGLWQTGGYLPQPGDIIFFDWLDDGQDGKPDHVGIVEWAGEGIVYTIEGNSGDTCKSKSYSIDHSEILGYGTYTG